MAKAWYNHLTWKPFVLFDRVKVFYLVDSKLSKIRDFFLPQNYLWCLPTNYWHPGIYGRRPCSFWVLNGYAVGNICLGFWCNLLDTTTFLKEMEQKKCHIGHVFWSMMILIFNRKSTALPRGEKSQMVQPQCVTLLCFPEVKKGRRLGYRPCGYPILPNKKPKKLLGSWLALFSYNSNVAT